MLGGLSKNLRYFIGRIVRETGLALDRHGSKLTRDIAYLEPLSRHRTIQPLYGQEPVIFDTALIADNATLIGEVILGDQTKIGFGVVARGDIYAVRIGNQSEIGDNTIISCNLNRLPGGVPQSVNIGNNVSIGPGCVIQSCIIDDNVNIGSRSLILDGSQIERGSIIEPNSVVPPGRVIPGGQVWGGNPVLYIRDVDQQISGDKY